MYQTKRKAVDHYNDGDLKKFKGYDEVQFESRVSRALEHVKTILDNTRNPQLPADVQHDYEDKYLLSEFLGNSTISALINSLEWLGVSSKPFKQLKEWSKTHSVTLRLKAEEECLFLRKEEREVASNTKQVTVRKEGTTEHFTVTKVTEYFWKISTKWELVVFAGVDHEKGITIQSHSGSVERKTNVDKTPRPKNTVRPAIDMNITWILQNTDDERTPKFTINRKSKKCRTPRRNLEVNRALEFVGNFHHWAKSVQSYFTIHVFPEELNHGIDLSAINDNRLFVPVLPLFNAPPTDESSSSTTPSTSASPAGGDTKLPPVFFTAFLSEQHRTFEAKSKEIAKIFPANDKLINLTAARLLVTLIHVAHVCEAYSEGVDYIESMLQKQLIAAIGKVVTPSDFANYLTFHNRKIYREEYCPQAFSYAIRRPDHYPEGMLSIEAQSDDGSISSPISTIVAQDIARRPMYFEINAATKVAFLGDRYVHGYVSHQFAEESGSQLSLIARARQFSSFILLVGRIASANLFEPKYATIIQNKDELKIPLLLETIPTPKEFKDAISSLSPEQQKFCKAFRSMQLESTLFGVCVIQIKPQLEKLLKIPEDSLTKEIQLTQDLLDLFIKYQIPSDLVSYDGEDGNNADAKIAKVKGYVQKMQDMVSGKKRTELLEAEMQQDYRFTEYDYSSVKRGRYGGDRGERERERERDRDRDRRDSRESMTNSINKRHRSRSRERAMVTGESHTAPAPQQPAAPSTQQTPQQTKIQEQERPKEGDQIMSDGAVVVDYTKIPIELEQKFDDLDENNALRPTIITPGQTWSKKSQPSLLSEPQSSSLTPTEQATERNKAFDLFDALTKSGVLTIDYASLHVVIASTHCFDKNIIQTVVQDNINPIEKVENSSLIVASTIHHVAPAALIEPAHLERISSTSPLLLGNTNAISNSNNNMDL